MKIKEKTISPSIVTDAICLRLGATFKTDPYSTFLANRSLTELARFCAGQEQETAPMDDVTLLQRSFASAGTLFGSAFTSAVSKTVLAFYDELDPTWRRWCNFTTTKRLSGERMELDAIKTPPQVAPGKKFPKSLTQGKTRALSVPKSGHIFDVDLSALLADDTGFIGRLLREHVASCIRLEEQTCYDILETPGTLDGVAFFSSTHGNLLTSAALAADKLGDAVKTIRNMTSRTDVKLQLKPAALIVPTALERTARALVVTLFNRENDPDRLDVIISSELTSTTSWYLAAEKKQTDSLIMAFLEGQVAPQVERVKAFEIDGQRYKIRHRVIAKAVQPSGIIKNTS